MLRSFSATVVDGLVALLLCYLLSGGPVGSFFARRAIVTLHIDSATTLWKGVVPMLLGDLGNFSYSFPLAMLLIILAEPLAGTSPGKALLHLRIVEASGQTVPASHVWARTFVKGTPLWGLVIALVSGSWVVALVAAVLGLMVIVNTLSSWIAGTQALHDRITNTQVVHCA